MGLNFVKKNSNMYQFIDATWNPIKGKCMHDCKYCYMKIWGEQNSLRLDENEMRTDLGQGNFIFVGSSTDMVAEDVSPAWIERVLEHSRMFKGNRYLFQSKNPEAFTCCDIHFPKDVILGTTIESNRDYPEISKAPVIKDRVEAMIELRAMGYKIMVTIEPVLDFDVDELVEIIQAIKPSWVNLGADSCGHNLPEPTVGKLLELNNRIDIKQKKNMKRLMKLKHHEHRKTESNS